MPVSIIDVEVRDQAFQKLTAQFAAFQTAVKAQPSAWAALSKQAAGVATAIGGAETTMAGLTAGTQLALTGQKNLFRQASATRTVFHSLVDDSAKLAKNVAGIGRELLKWGGIGGVFSGLLGAGGLFGMERMASSVSGQLRAAQGLGVTTGEQNALRINYSRYTDTDAMMSRLADAKQDYTKRAYLGSILGVDDAQLDRMDPAQLLQMFVRKSRGVMAAGDGSMQYANAMHLTDFAPMEDLRRMGIASDKELDAREAATGRDTSAFQVDDKTSRAWQNFNTQLDRSGEQIRVTFVNGLVPLAPSLTHLSDEFSKLLATVMSQPLLKQWIDDAAGGFERLANYIGTPKFKEDVKQFEADVASFVHWVGRGVSMLERVFAPGDPNAAPGAPGSAKDRTGAPSNAFQRGTGLGMGENAPDNNPFNLKFANQPGTTQGRVAADGGNFAHFTDARAASAADLNQFMLYQKSGITTLEDMILKATPRATNPNVDKEIDDVAKMLGKQRTDAVNLTDPMEATRFLSGIAKWETGYKDSGPINLGIRDRLGLYGEKGAGGPVNDNGNAARAYQNAADHLGEGPDQANSFLHANGQQIDAAHTAWCAAFVNAGLKSVGIDGSGSAVATSFEKWGKAAGWGELKQGDIAVESRGHAPGQPGGHVGFATGQTRTVNGRTQFELLSGNQGGKVSRTWEEESAFDLRRQANDASGAPSVPPADMPINHGIPDGLAFNMPQSGGGVKVVVMNQTGGSALVQAQMLAS